MFGRNLAWSIGIGALVAAAVARQFLTPPGTARPSGADLAFELVWRGVVYGTVDALVLFVFPALVAVDCCSPRSAPSCLVVADANPVVRS